MAENPSLLRQEMEMTLQAVPITTDRRQDRVAGLAMSERRFYQAILRAFPEFGGPPDHAWLRAEAPQHGVNLDAVLTRLEQRDLIVRDPTTGVITVAYPFSLRPTRHQVELEGGQSVYAMCAIDALGIPFMLGCPARIVSTDPIRGEPIRVAVRADEVQWDPAEAVVLVGCVGGTGPAAETCCGFVNFFRSVESAEA